MNKYKYLIRFYRLVAILTLLVIGLYLIASPKWQNKSLSAISPDSTAENVVGMAVALTSDPTSLDPALTFGADPWLVTSQIYDTLVIAESIKFLPEPGLAESWTVSPNGLNWSFEIRPGIKFHDNTDLDAQAVAYNLQRWWDPDHPQYDEGFTYFNYLFGGPKGDPASVITDIYVANTTSVVIQLIAPNSQLPSMLTAPPFAIASPTAIQAGSLTTQPVGSGPFKFVEWQIGSVIKLAGTEYWAGSPKMDNLDFHIISASEDRLLALQNDQIQASDQLSDQHVTVAAKDARLRSLWHPANDTGYLGINSSRTALEHPMVRQAIAHALNKQKILTESYPSGVESALDLVPSGLWGADPGLEDYEYDPTHAISLLTQAGYPHGFATTLAFRTASRSYLPNPAMTAAAIAADLEAVGIMVTVQEYETGVFFDKLLNGELDLFLLGWILDYPHPYNVYASVLCSGLGQGLGPTDTELCDTLDTALETTDFSEQLDLYHSVSRRAHETLPVIPIVHSRSPFVVRHDVLGAFFGPYDLTNYRDVVFATTGSYLPIAATK